MIIGFAWASENHQSGLELIEQLRAAAPPDEEEVAKYWLNVYGFWDDPAEDERLSEFAWKAYTLMQPFGSTVSTSTSSAQKPDKTSSRPHVRPTGRIHMTDWLH